MRVKELIEVLQGLNQEAVVYVSGDSEGNYFSPADDQLSHDEYFDDEYERVFCDEGEEPPDMREYTEAVVIWSTR